MSETRPTMWDCWERHRGHATMKLDTFPGAQQRHFSRYQGTGVVLLEIGVFHGGSLQIYRDYFGPDATIIGADVDPECRQWVPAEFDLHIGDQEDPAFLARLREQIPHVDIVIDDGGHTMSQQIATFDGLYDHVAADGIYVCEDTHTSYWDVYGGGARRSGTFIESAKQKIDLLNADYSEDGDLVADEFTRSCASITFHSGMVVFEKSPIDPPQYLANDGAKVLRHPLKTKRAGSA